MHSNEANPGPEENYFENASFFYLFTEKKKKKISKEKKKKRGKLHGQKERVRERKEEKRFSIIAVRRIVKIENAQKRKKKKKVQLSKRIYNRSNYKL